METQALLERAHLLLEQKRYKDAEAYIKKVLEQEPENDYALSVLARCFLNSKRFKEGIDAINQAIAIDPNESFYFYLLGFGYYQQNNHEAAIRYLEKAIAINPYAAEYFGLLAFVYIAEVEFERALEKANEGLAVEADNLTCLNARSTALNKLKRTDDAIETMNTALAQDPDNAITHSSIGWNLLERGQHKNSQKHFMEALRINPDNASAKTGLKEALKSNVLLYKWLLQYSFWISNKGKNYQVAFPIVLYVVFRVLITVFEQNEKANNFTWIIIAVYLFIVVISWTIGSIANFVLLFHPVGKYALTNTEKWSAINVVMALSTGILVMLLSGFAEGTRYDAMFMMGIVCFSLALPLGRIDYPVKWKGKTWKENYANTLVALGLLTLVVFIVAPQAAMPLAIVYGIAFIIYNWTGIAS